LIHQGDTITLRTLGAVYSYRVVATRVVEPDDVQALEPDGKDILTLVTCFPFYLVGPAPKRFIIKAARLPGV
jgi:sortase A